MHQRAVLAGGCFWGMQDLIRKRPGIISTRVGYTGGDIPNATYRNHGTHAEGIEIVFDPTVTSYRHILEFFFQIHDPTTKDRQGNDRGSSYRSAIYYASEAQRAITEVNLSCYVFHGPDLLRSLDEIRSDNAQGEYYITDCPGVLLAAGKDVRALNVLEPCESLSINNMDELAVVEEAMRAMGSHRT